MLKRASARRIVAILSVMVLLGAPTGRALAEPCVQFPPRMSADVRGYTWTGTVTDVHQTGARNERGIATWAISFAVDHVFERRRLPSGVRLAAGSDVTLRSDDCGRSGDLGMHVGTRYLVSTSRLTAGTFPSDWIVAWQLERDRMTLVTAMYGAGGIWPRLRDAATPTEALQAVAPGAAWPPADTGTASGVGYEDGGRARSLVILATTALLTRLLFVRRRRSLGAIREGA